MILSFVLLRVFALASVTLGVLQPIQPRHEAYLDVEPVETTHFLDLVKKIKLSHYRLGNSKRLGAVGPEIASLIPEAVELVPKRILPPAVKGGKPIVQLNVPVVNDNMLFWIAVGSQKELIKRVEALTNSMSRQIGEVGHLMGETAKLEHLLSESSSEESDLRIRASIAEAEIAQSRLEGEMQRAQDETDYLDLQREREIFELKRNEEFIASRLAQEEATSRKQAKEEMKIRFETNAKIDRTKTEAAEALSVMQYERDITLQKVSEEMKADTAKAIAEATAEVERANEDVHIRKLKAEAEQSRKRNIAAINAIAIHASSSLVAASKNPGQVLLCIWYIALLATGIYTAREVAKLCRVVLEQALGKPKLIRETTRKSVLYQGFESLLVILMELLNVAIQIDQEDAFHDVVLENDLKQRILSIATATEKVRKNGAPHRHVLFFGPPGTGKTMVARKMAKSIGMDYALMSGGDVGPLGNDAVTQIHNLFRWARFSNKGVLLFIDEAECFLGDRSNISMSETAHNSLNALLYNTGTERTDFMMILATNRAEDLDPAVLDRCDESLLFPLPDSACRRKLLTDYFLEYVRPMEEGAKRCEPKNRIVATLQTLFLTQDPFQATIEDEVMNTEQLNDIVAKTGGFSGREISKLMIAVQGAIFASSDGILTPIMIEKIVSIKVKEHNMKVEMMTKPIAEEAANLVVLTPTRACKTESLANDLVFEETDLSFESKSEDVETNANASNNLSDLSCSSSEKEVDAPDNSRACRNQVAKEESIISNEVVVPTKSSAKLDNKIVEEETQLSEQGLLSTNCSSEEETRSSDRHSQFSKQDFVSTNCTCDVM